jgi:hypothetical protein
LKKQSPKSNPNQFLTTLIHDYCHGKSRRKVWSTSVIQNLPKLKFAQEAKNIPIWSPWCSISCKILMPYLKSKKK